MTALANERIAYFNGRFLPEREVVVPFRDRGFMAGDAAFDTARTFGHRLFKLKEHVDRLYRSLRYLRIDPGLPPAEMARVTEEVLARNLHLLGREDDYWVSQRVSRGVPAADDRPRDLTPTVIVECTPLPLAERAPLYRDGIAVHVPSVRRVSPDMLSPRAKTHNYLNLVMGDLEARAADPRAWAILLDADGNLSEGIGSNIFLVREGALLTPEARRVLPGISRETVIELAGPLGLPVRETAIDLYDAYTAEEAFLTSTSLCICPVRSINGRPLGSDRLPGPVTQRLIDAYAALVGFDFVAQYRSRLAG